MTFTQIVEVDAARAQVYEHGWQSWSPTTTYHLDEGPYRSSAPDVHVMNYRPDNHPGDDTFCGEGLLALATGLGDFHVFAAPFASTQIASIYAHVDGNTVRIESDGPVEEWIDWNRRDLATALRAWAKVWAGKNARITKRPPTAWCTWYHYFRDVTADDVRENLDAMDELDLDFDVVQIDDGYQREIGDWLTWSERFGELPPLVDEIHARGRRAGIWVAPFIVGEKSEVAQEHPDWLVPHVTAGRNWEQNLSVLDVTNPDAAAYLTHVFKTLHDLGIDYFKIDFIYAGAIEGRRLHDVTGVEAYHRGLSLIREAIGPDSFLLGCGAPIIASVGYVDAMRVGPDVGLGYAAEFGDRSRPSQESATMTSAARQWMDGVWWVNDPDCLIVRPEVERRGEWAEFISQYRGLFTSGDRLRSLDEWGLEQTRELLNRTQQ